MTSDVEAGAVRIDRVREPDAVRLVDIRKRFGAFEAIRGVSLTLRAGEVLGLVGENGAGKSTIIKILGGVHAPDEGCYEISGVPVALTSAADARAYGLTVVHQEPAIFPDLGAAENVFMGRYPTKALGIVNRGLTSELVRRALTDLGITIDLDRPMRDLSIGHHQLVEIAKGLTSGSQVIVLDEPTAALSPSEARDLFRIVRTLTAKGVAVLFVSHRLEEVFAICDRILVMRDGERVFEAPASELTRDDVIRHMIGRRLDALFPTLIDPVAPVMLKANSLGRGHVFRDVSFEVRRGEILGLAGLVGSGRSEIARAIFGIDRLERGSLAIAGHSVTIRSTREAMRLGVALVPEDRHEQGVLLDWTITHNITLTVLSRVAGAIGLLRPDRERALASDYAKNLSVRMRGVNDLLRALSGGNQQKVVLAKWLATNPVVLIVDEPTRGIDVGAKAEVHRILAELAARGVAILMISSDLPELLGMTHRILVIRNGRVGGVFNTASADQERIMAVAAGRHSSALPERPGLTPGPRRRGPSLAMRRELNLVGVMAALCGLMAVLQPRFLALDNLQDIFRDAGVLAVLAVGQAVVMITRNLDLSVGSVAGVAAYLSAAIMVVRPELGVIAGLLIALLAGAGMGLLNGTLVVLGRVPSIVVTLGSLYALQGLLALPLMAGGGNEIGSSAMPQLYLDIATVRLAGVPLIAAVAAALAAVVGLALGYLPQGRALYAMGSNPSAARLIGLPGRRIVMGAFVFSGMTAAIGGFLLGARFGYVGPDTGNGLELQAIAAAVIGGVAIFGGSGSPGGAAVGAVLLGMIANALAVMNVPGVWLQAITGIFILGAISLQKLLDRNRVTPSPEAAA